MATTTIARPTKLQIIVIKPSGKFIDKADVTVTWDNAASFEEVKATATAKTNNGKAAFGIPDTVDGTPLAGTVEVKRRCHGPVVGRNEAFKNGPLKVRILVDQTGLHLPDHPPPAADESPFVLWGRPRIVKVGTGKAILPALELALVEGGTLGVEHNSVLTRRLSSPHVPETDPRPVVSQVDEELIFHIAHGHVALEPATDYTFKHESEDQDCTNGQCKIVPPSNSPTGRDPPSPPFPTKYIPKIGVRNGVMGRVRYMNMVQADMAGDGGRAFTFGMTEAQMLNPRNVVGAIRLGLLLSDPGVDVRVVLTAGFLRFFDGKRELDKFNKVLLANPDQNASGTVTYPLGKLKYDAHGRGRAIDVAGLMRDHPE